MRQIAELIAQRRAGERSKPILIVHIGGGKTGSSAIQTFLGRNRVQLAAQGIIVPDEQLGSGRGYGNQVFFFADLAQRADGAEILKAKLRDLVAERHVGRGTRHRPGEPSPVAIVLSAENLSNVGDQHHLFEGLSAEFDIAVLLYVRSQVSYYQAAWQQWHCKRGIERRQWLAQSAHLGDWLGAAERWSQIEPSAFEVKVFERSLLVGGDIVADFCATLRIDQTSLLPNDEPVNEALGVHVSRLFEDVHHLFEDTHDNRIRDFLRALDIRSARPRAGETLFTDEELCLIREHHRERNKALKDRFLPDRGDAELFSDFEAALQYVDDAEITRRNQAVLFELLLKVSLLTEEDPSGISTKSRGRGTRIPAIDRVRRWAFRS